MSKAKITYIHLNPKAHMFYDQHSGVKIIPGQQVEFPEEEIEKFPKLKSALRNGHISTGVADPTKTTIPYAQAEENKNPTGKGADSKEEGKGSDDDDDDDDDKREEGEAIEDMTKTELINYIRDNDPSSEPKKVLKTLSEDDLIKKAKAIEAAGK